MAVHPAGQPLVSPQWLRDRLAEPGIQVVENAWVRESYARAHIPGAVPVRCHPHLKRFDTAGQKTQHVMSEREFGELCHDLGLRRDRHCVVYDDYHGLFAARFRVVCRYYGFDNVSVLDGGWFGWLAEGHPVSAQVAEPVAGSDITAAPRSGLFVGLRELQSLQTDPAVQIWDTRRLAEFDGTEETDNERDGHIPGALNLAWTELLTGEDIDGTPRFCKARPELAALLDGLGLRPDRTIITCCQSGIRAAFCLQVLEMLGYDRHRLYDASMGEWANLPTTPLTTEAT